MSEQSQSALSDSSASGRRSAKRGRIVAEIRRQILEGVFAPGSRLPTRSNLETRFGVSSVTIQRAIDALIEDGFIYARDRQGTYVSETPPHLSRYGMVIPGRRTDMVRWTRFYAALCNEATALTVHRARQVNVYYGVDERDAERDYLALARDLEAHRLAGLIFVGAPHNLMSTPLVNQPGIPRVGVMSEPMGEIPAVDVDWASLLSRAAHYLASRGRRRVAFLLYGHLNLQEDLPVLADGWRVTAPSYWTQYATPWPPQSARNATELLMRAPASQRPDALVITDDNLVEQATTGLMAAGVRVPDDVEVVAHTNFPWPTPSLVPVKRLGFDARAIIQRCLDVLECQRRREKPVEMTKVAAVFEEEIGAAKK